MRGGGGPPPGFANHLATSPPPPTSISQQQLLESLQVSQFIDEFEAAGLLVLCSSSVYSVGNGSRLLSLREGFIPGPVFHKSVVA
jgi:hypothetical protein